MSKVSKKEFEKFLGKQKRLAAINWEDRKGKWLAQVEQFYKKVRKFLGEYEKSGKVSLSERRKLISEEGIGQYHIDQLIVKFGGQEVVFDPIGTVLIGVQGRIDMKSHLGTVMFVLVDKRADSPSSLYNKSYPAMKSASFDQRGWKISTSPPVIKYLDFNEESFFDALLEIVNA
jgi:hypothetical protein